MHIGTILAILFEPMFYKYAYDLEMTLKSENHSYFNM